VARWQLLAGPATAAPTVELTTAHARKVVWKLREPSTLTFAMDGRHPQAADVNELATDVHLLRDGTVLYTGRVAQSKDDIGDAGHGLTVDTTDTRGLLARRLWETAPFTDFTAVEQVTVAVALLDHAQSRTGGNLGITTTGIPATGMLTTRRVTEGAPIYDELKWLAEVGDPSLSSTPGFDWDISAGWTGRTFQLWYPARGTDAGVILDYTYTGRPRSSVVAKLTRTLDPSTYANAVRASGAEATTTPASRVAGDVASRPEGRWCASLAYPEVIAQAALDSKADERLAALGVLTPTYAVTLAPGAWDGPEHIWLGDTVRLYLRSGRLADDVSLRVSEVAVDLGDSGGETVTLTVGALRGTVLMRIRDQERRVASLERRQ
jgi:hypothetical protein